ncbi:hypothetical protein SAMN05216188_105149 [Lentzea xinjiangensis]|uniref:Uncharacterized protein n=1 Tax=Lentzea xinjiangensis TaxID=402600 RepID=A0A1H9IZP2_9PSEU|nr:hypothetical protein [Lentzea xinjiangensis]SEQ80002.1 hypothetical protein SAMN05216188_105149 [Lentzea xinjiangensis]
MRSAGFFGALLAAALVAVTIASSASDTEPTESNSKTALVIGPCTTGEC